MKKIFLIFCITLVFTALAYGERDAGEQDPNFVGDFYCAEGHCEGGTGS